MQEDNRQVALNYANKLLKEKGLKLYKLEAITDSRFEIKAAKDSFVMPLIVQIFELEVVNKE